MPKIPFQLIVFISSCGLLAISMPVYSGSSVEEMNGQCHFERKQLNSFAERARECFTAQVRQTARGDANNQEDFPKLIKPISLSLGNNLRLNVAGSAKLSTQVLDFPSGASVTSSITEHTLAAVVCTPQTAIRTSSHRKSTSSSALVCPNHEAILESLGTEESGDLNPLLASKMPDVNASNAERSMLRWLDWQSPNGVGLTALSSGSASSVIVSLKDGRSIFTMISNGNSVIHVCHPQQPLHQKMTTAPTPSSYHCDRYENGVKRTS